MSHVIKFHEGYSEDDFQEAVGDFVWVVKQRQKHVVIIISADANWSVGHKLRADEMVLGDYGLGDRDERGALFLDVASNLRFRFAEFLFDHNLGKHSRIGLDGTPT